MENLKSMNDRRCLLPTAYFSHHTPYLGPPEL